MNDSTESPRGWAWLLRRAPYWLGPTLLALLLLLTIWGFIGVNLVNARRHATRDAHMDTAVLAGVMQENLQRSVEAIDAQLHLLRDMYARDPDDFAAAVARTEFLLRDLTVQVSVVGADGLLRYSNLQPNAPRIDLSDRAHIRAQLDNTKDALFISKPVVGRLSGLTTVQFTRKILDTQGSLLGVAVISLDTRQLARLRDTLNLDDVHLLIVGRDGVVRAAAPGVEMIGQDISASRLLEEAKAAPAADYRGVLTPGLPESFVSFRRVNDYGLIVAASEPETTAFADYWNNVQQYIGLGIAISVLIISFNAGLARYRRRSRLILQENEQRLRDYADAAADWFWETDKDYRITYISSNFEKLMGVPVASMLGRTSFETQFGNNLSVSWQTHLDDLRQRKPFRDFTFVHASDTLSPKWVRTSGLPLFGRDGAFLGYRGIAREVSAAIEAEAEARRWSEAFDKAAFGIAIVDAKSHNFITVNPAYAAMHGMTQEELRGYSAELLYAPEERSDLEKFRDSAARMGHVSFEAARLCKDGSRFIGHVNITDVRDAEGHRAYRISTVLDITESRRMQAHLQQAQRMEAIGQLTAGIAHDFNNLLGAIISNQDLIIDEATRDPAATRRHAKEALEAALSGADLVKRMLAFGRQQAMRPLPVEFNELSDSVLPIIHRTIGQNIEVKISSVPNLWTMLADPVQVESALLNLAINARDAMPGGGTLSISARNVTIDAELFAELLSPKPGDYVLISVTDSGAGMSADVVSHAFEPFYTTKGVGEGTGLGLSMVLGSMEQLGGTAKIYSESGQGTTVTLYLPRAVPPAPATAVAAAAAERTAPRGKERILVVEDNALIRSSVVAMLQNLGYQAEEAADAPAALLLLERKAGFDLLFTDIVLPGRISGLDLASAVRARKPEVAILLTSGFAKPAQYQAQINDPGLTVLVKPYRKAILAERVREALNQGRAKAN